MCFVTAANTENESDSDIEYLGSEGNDSGISFLLLKVHKVKLSVHNYEM